MNTLPTKHEIIELFKPAFEICPDEAYSSVNIQITRMNEEIRVEVGVYNSKFREIHRGDSFEAVILERDKFNPENVRAAKIAELKKEIEKLENYEQNQ